jgi:hypothetical protein
MLGAKVGIAVSTDEAFMPKNFGDFLQCLSMANNFEPVSAIKIEPLFQG